MGKRLRLAEGLAKGELKGQELDEALANEIIVRHAETLKKETKKEKNIKKKQELKEE